jgi:hypothetical protein
MATNCWLYLQAHVHQTCYKSMGATGGMDFFGHSLLRSIIFLLQSSQQRSMAMDIGFPRGLSFINASFLRHLSPGRGIAMGAGFLRG